MNIAHITEDKASRYLDHSLHTVRGDEVTLMIWWSSDGSVEPVTFRGNIGEMKALFGRITEQLTFLSRHTPYLGEDAAEQAVADLAEEELLQAG